MAVEVEYCDSTKFNTYGGHSPITLYWTCITQLLEAIGEDLCNDIIQLPRGHSCIYSEALLPCSLGENPTWPGSYFHHVKYTHPWANAFY